MWNYTIKYIFFTWASWGSMFMKSWVTFHLSRLYHIVPWKLSPPFKSMESGSLSRACLMRVVSRANPPIHGSGGLQTVPPRLVSTNLKLSLNSLLVYFCKFCWPFSNGIHMTIELNLWIEWRELRYKICIPISFISVRRNQQYVTYLLLNYYDW